MRPTAASTIALPVLVALLVCLIPTTIGGLLPAIGIAGMDRLIQHNVIALSGRAVEAAGDVDVVLLDKTGTITLGNRMATDFIPAEGVTREELAEAALLSSLADETPEGRSIVALAKHLLAVRGRDIKTPDPSCFVPFTPELRMSGVSLDGREIRKGATDAVAAFVTAKGGTIPESVEQAADRVGREGGTPLVVADSGRALGVIQLKDVLKEGIKERLHQLRLMGIRSTMITGDNPLTAAAIAAEAGIDDFVAQARPEEKLRLIRKYQGEGHLVAMIGDGTNDAPALAQADVAVAMNAGTQASREAANMVDLDSNPTKLLDIVEIGKQILMTRGALTTFSVANDVAKYFAIIPAIFVQVFPVLAVLNVMRLATPQSAILSAIIFNAIIIPLLIPLALKGIKYRPITAQALLWRNLVIYGVGGLALPFVGIKVIDLVVVLLHLGLRRLSMRELIRALLIFLVLYAPDRSRLSARHHGPCPALLRREGRREPGYGPRARRRVGAHRTEIHGSPVLSRPAVGERLRREQLRGHQFRACQCEVSRRGGSQGEGRRAARTASVRTHRCRPTSSSPRQADSTPISASRRPLSRCRGLPTAGASRRRRS